MGGYAETYADAVYDNNYANEKWITRIGGKWITWPYEAMNDSMIYIRLPKKLPSDWIKSVLTSDGLLRFEMRFCHMSVGCFDQKIAFVIVEDGHLDGKSFHTVSIDEVPK